MDGAAADWYDGIADADKANFGEFEKAFIQRYGIPTDLKYKQRSDMFRRKQGMEEPVEEFISGILKMRKECGASEEDAISAVLCH